MADKRIDQLVAATTLGNNDLLVLEQNNQAKKMSGATLASFVYNAATDKIAEVNQAVADAQDAVDSLEEQKNTIAEAVASMADLGTDTTLSTTGMAADAKAAGDRIKEVETAALAGLDQAEITGVAVASFDDGADDVPVKALKIAIEPKQDLHGQANPYPAGGGKNKLSLTGSYTADQSQNVIQKRDIDPIPAGQYTFAATSSAAAAWGATFYDAQDNAIGNFESLTSNAGRQSRTATITDTATQFKLYVNAATTISDMQLEAGSTATSYAPYSNICPITGWTEANVMRTGKNLFDINTVDSSVRVAGTDTVSLEGWTRNLMTGGGSNAVTPQQAASFPILPSGTYTLSFKVLSGNANKNLRLYAVSTADGSAVGLTEGSPLTKSDGTKYFTFTTNTTIRYELSGLTTNETSIVGNIQIELGSNATAYEPHQGETYSITFPSEAGTVYGGTLDVTNGVLTAEYGRITNFNSLSSSGTSTTGAYRYVLTVSAKNYSVAESKSNALRFSALYNGYANDFYQNTTHMMIFLNKSTVSDAKQFLIDNNCEIIYPLATPITYTLTPQVVRTLLALNNIWADTGNILDLIYRRRPISDADIRQQIDEIRNAIADREDNGVASKNYAGGSLILIGDTLYEANGPITTGESIVPGSNCTATTVAAQIAYIKYIINSLGNLAYLSYENA